MHGESIGIAVTPTVAVAYAIVATFLFGLSRYPVMVSAAEPMADKGLASMPAE
jgi:AGZA family xanthine/uracil permease-like MFS transporter